MSVIEVTYDIDGMKYLKADCFGQLASFERFVKPGAVRYINGYLFFANCISAQDIGLLSDLTFKRKVYWCLVEISDMKKDKKDYEVQRNYINTFYDSLSK